MKNYHAYIALTEGRKVVAVAGFTPRQALTALDILERSDRRSQGVKILKAAKAVKSNQTLWASRRSIQGAVVEDAVPLPKRAATLVGLMCLSANEPGIVEAQNCLRRIAFGYAEPGEIMKPFAVTEGFGQSPIVLA